MISQYDILPEDLNHKPLHLSGEWLDRARDTGVILYVRGSTRRQNLLGRMANELASSEAALFVRKVPIVDTVIGEEKGYLNTFRTHLERAIRKARKLNIPVVASTRDRFIRHVGFDGASNATENPTDDEYRTLRMKFGYVGYFTIEHPDQRGRSRQTRVGRSRKKHRPKYKTRRKNKYLPKIRKLHEQGLSQREISALLNIPQPNISRWLK